MRVTAARPSTPARLFAWGGAIVFFLSLAYFLVAYATTFGMAARGNDSAAAITWNVILFTVFAAHHSVLARERVRTAVARLVSAGLERSFYVWIASLLFVGVCAFWQPVPGIAWQAEGAAALWMLRLLQVAGIGLILRSAAILDIRELAGIRRPEGLRLPGGAHQETVGRGGQASGTEFKTTGPYGWMRHPIYSGWFLLVFAASPMTMTRLVFAIVSCLYLLIAIPFEERSMRMTSGGAYERYASRVRWKLIPGVY